MNGYYLEYSFKDVFTLFSILFNRVFKNSRNNENYSDIDVDLVLKNIYVVSLPFRNDRQENMKREMRKQGLSFRFCYGIHGKVCLKKIYY